MTASKLYLDRNFPIDTVVDDCLLSRKGDLTMGWELTLPVTYNLSGEDYDALTRRLISCVAHIGEPWYIVHKQDVFHFLPYRPKDRSTFLGQSYETHFDGRLYLEHKCRIFFTVSSKANCDAGVSKNGFLSFISKPYFPSEQQIRSFVSRADDFIRSLCVDRITARRIKSEEYGGDGVHYGILDEQYRFYRKDGILSDIVPYNDRLERDGEVLVTYKINESAHINEVISNTDVVSSMCSNNTSVSLSTAAKCGVLLNCNHVYNQYIMTLPQVAVMSEVDLRMRRMHSGLSESANKVSYNELEQFVDEVNSVGTVAVRASFNVQAWSAASELDATKTLVGNALATMNTKAKFNAFDAPVLWYAGFPGAATELGADNFFTLPLGAAASLFTFESYDRDMETGSLYLCDRIRNVPVRLDFRDPRLPAYHRILCGPTGSGKSFFVNHLLSSDYDGGENIFVLDVFGSYEGLCEAIREESGGRDGVYLAWDERHPVGFNPFNNLSEWLAEGGNLREDSDDVIYFQSLLITMWTPKNGGWTSDRKAVLSLIIRDFIQKCGSKKDLVFDDFYRFLDTSVVPRILCKPVEKKGRKGEDEIDHFAYLDQKRKKSVKVEPMFIGNVRIDEAMFDIKSFVATITAYSLEGGHAALLNDPHPKDLLSNRFTVCELSVLVEIAKNDPVYYSVCVLCFMHAFDLKMRTSQDKKQMVIDEAWQAIGSETTAPYIKSLWKQARKFNTACMVITQQLSDLLSSDIVGDAIVGNSYITVLLDQSASQNNFDAVAERFGFSEHEVSMIMSMNREKDSRYSYREAFIRFTGIGCGVYRTEESYEAGLVFESNRDLKKPLFLLAEKVGGVIPAARELAEVNRKNYLLSNDKKS